MKGLVLQHAQFRGAEQQYPAVQTGNLYVKGTAEPLLTYPFFHFYLQWSAQTRQRPSIIAFRCGYTKTGGSEIPKGGHINSSFGTHEAPVIIF